MRLFARLIVLVAWACRIIPAEAATAAEYRERARDTANALDVKWYGMNNGLWNGEWWQSANIITALAEFGQLHESFRTVANWYLTNTFQKAPGTSAGAEPGTFINDYYDDEGWWALAWIAAYDLTGNSEFLQVAMGLFEDMTQAMTTPCGGSWWDKKHDQIAAIANEVFISTAAHLANRVPANKEYYLGWATATWEWFDTIGLINDEGVINDGIDPTTCKNNDGTVFSYNQGAIIGGLVGIHAATGNSTYLDRASAIAKAAIDALTDANGILTETGGDNLDATRAQFKGVFVRNLKYLQHAAPDEAFSSFLLANAESLWEKSRDASSGLIGSAWQGPFVSPDTPGAQASALDCLVAAATVA